MRKTQNPKVKTQTKCQFDFKFQYDFLPLAEPLYAQVTYSKSDTVCSFVYNIYSETSYGFDKFPPMFKFVSIFTAVDEFLDNLFS